MPQIPWNPKYPQPPSALGAERQVQGTSRWFERLAPQRAPRAAAEVVLAPPAATPHESSGRSPIAKAKAWVAGLRSESLRDTSSFLFSLVVHAVLLIILALIIPRQGTGRGGVALIVDVDGDAETPVVPEDLSVSIEQVESQSAPVLSTALPTPQAAEVPEITTPFAAPTPTSVISRPSHQPNYVPQESLLIRSTLPVGGGIEGRTQTARARLVGQRGGTPESEDAVELGLVWLAAHQRADGSWSLRFNDPPCRQQCVNPGTMETTTGATALALLPFLGAGYSHQTGPYQDVVHKGLYYLTSRMVQTPHGGDLHENITMYAHGIATLALCEGYAMTGDENLRPYAQQAVDFICHAQHPRGGWRYFPGQPGDTTVTGWQVMALKSAKLARLHVPSSTTQLVSDYLDSVQDANGAFYGYQSPEKKPGPTAVGLLLRMYHGWGRDDPRIVRGVTYLAYDGPSQTDIYFDYYATQVLNHFDGPLWAKWNARMRDYLVRTQVKSGHERGSWFFPDKHGTVGGRLYTTALCLMILEVYYRYMPLYGQDAVESSF